MGIHLGEYLYWGEVTNKGFSTWGNFYFWTGTNGKLVPLRLQLVGRCSPDLNNKRVRFYKPVNEDPPKVIPPELARSIRYRQIGATGTMTAQGWVKQLPCEPEEFYIRSKLGEAPPTTWVRHLYLEWFGQNGRVVVETGGYVVERMEREAEEAGMPDVWVEEENLAFPQHALSSGPPAPPQIIAMRLQEDGEVEVEEIRADEFEEDALLDALDDYDEDAEQLDRYDEYFTEEDAKADLKEMETLDDCIDNAAGIPILSIATELRSLPKPETLDDAGIEEELKNAAAMLAMFNVCFDLCPHENLREAYTELVERALPELEIFQELITGNTVQHLCLSEGCPECEKEMKRDEERFFRSRNAEGDADLDLDGDDVPF